MSISRHNYETWFLLYVDRELTASEQQDVEAFAAANPDLQAELEMLKETVLPAEPLSFDAKNTLLKAAAIEEPDTASLLLLLDNELPVAEQKQLLQQIDTNPLLQKEWNTLQEVKLGAEKIIFEHKELLYRKEERRVVPMRWWQLAAAAILVGIGLWGTVRFVNKEAAIAPETATTTAPKNNTPGTPGNSQRADNGNSASLPSSVVVAPLDQSSTKSDPASVASSETHVTPGKQSPAVNIPQQKVVKDISNNTANEIAQQRPQPAPENLVPEKKYEAVGNNMDVASVSPNRKNEIIEAPLDNPTQTANTYAVHTVASNEKVTYLNPDDEEEDRPRKTKLGGFFKKVKRVFERKTKINTGSSDDVRVANLAIAMD